MNVTTTIAEIRCFHQTAAWHQRTIIGNTNTCAVFTSRPRRTSQRLKSFTRGPENHSTSHNTGTRTSPYSAMSLRTENLSLELPAAVKGGSADPLYVPHEDIFFDVGDARYVAWSTSQVRDCMRTPRDLLVD